MYDRAIKVLTEVMAVAKINNDNIDKTISLPWDVPINFINVQYSYSNKVQYGFKKILNTFSERYLICSHNKRT